MGPNANFGRDFCTLSERAVCWVTLSTCLTPFALRNCWQKYFFIGEPMVWVLVALVLCWSWREKGSIPSKWFIKFSVNLVPLTWRALLDVMETFNVPTQFLWQFYMTPTNGWIKLIDNFRGYFAFFIISGINYLTALISRIKLGCTHLALGSFSFVIENMRSDQTPNVFFLLFDIISYF